MGDEKRPSNPSDCSWGVNPLSTNEPSVKFTKEVWNTLRDVLGSGADTEVRQQLEFLFLDVLPASRDGWSSWNDEAALYSGVAETAETLQLALRKLGERCGFEILGFEALADFGRCGGTEEGARRYIKFADDLARIAGRSERRAALLRNLGRPANNVDLLRNSIWASAASVFEATTRLRATANNKSDPKSVFEKARDHGHRRMSVAVAAMVMRVSATAVSCS